MVRAPYAASSKRPKKLPLPYASRRPHATVLYQLVKDHFAEFHRYATESYDKPLPRYVEKEIRGYLQCGDFAHGFVQLVCQRCANEVLVPFSCKSRSICPSCAGRRMAAQAAHLVDAVVPAVPVRQYVLSLPFDLSLLAATNPVVLRAITRVHYEELTKHYRACARNQGTIDKTYPGAVTFVQRFGSSLNLHLHLHVCVLDGVYIEQQDDAPTFLPAPPLRKDQLHKLTEKVALRVAKWLRKRGYSKDEHDYSSNEPRQLSFAEMLAHQAAQRGSIEQVQDDDDDAKADAAHPAACPPLRDEAATFFGFNPHASTRIAADDDVGRERLFRYGLRPPFSLGRFRMLRDGRVCYRIKKSNRRASRCRIMTLIECLARLCALIPPPGHDQNPG